MKEKLTSRKLWAAVVGVVTGICLIVAGNVTEGATTVLASVLGYIVAEGYIDAAAVKAALEIADAVEDKLNADDGEEE